MIIGEVLYPETDHPRRRIKCDKCQINYSHKSYKNLIDNYKILYLEALSSEVEYCSCIMCHDCFFDNLNKVTGEHEKLEGEAMVFFIITKENELELNFESSDSSDADEEEQQLYMEDFIKEILES